MCYSEKLAEATRKFAGLQSDLNVAENADPVTNTGLRRRVPALLKNKNKVLGTSREQVVRKSMHDIKLAFSEFYLSLILLQNYQSLNFTGFRKILKKHDKVYLPLCLVLAVAPSTSQNSDDIVSGVTQKCKISELLLVWLATIFLRHNAM